MKLFFVFILLFLLRVMSSITADLIYLILAFMAVLGGKNTIYAFILCWFFTLINPVLAPDSSLGMIGRYLVIIGGLLGAVFRMLFQKNKFFNKYALYTGLMFLMIFVHGLIFSGIPSISILKILSWFCVFSVLFYCWNSLDNLNRNLVFEKILYLLIIILIFSIPFLFIPAIGFARNSTGFQGLLNHPQAFGPTIALLGVIVGGKILANKNNSFFDLFLFVLCIVFIILSESRTAGFGLLIALIVSLILNPIFNKKSFTEANPIFKNKWTYFYSIIILFFAYLFSGLYLSKVKDYLFKRTDSSSLLEAAANSRGGLVENMLINIDNNLLTGIGFGMSSNTDDMKIEVDPFFCIVICIVCLNLGEYMFFSGGGMGMLMLIFFTFSVVLKK